MTSLKSSSVRAMARLKTEQKLPRLDRHPSSQVQQEREAAAAPMTCLRRHWRTLFVSSRAEELTQIYWKKTRLKSCSTLILIMKKSSQSSRWRSKKTTTRMVRVKLTRNHTRCFSTSTHCARITRCSCCLRSTASPRSSPTSSSNFSSKSSKWAASRHSVSATIQWAPTVS